MQFEVDFIVALQSVASEGLTAFFEIISLLGSYLGFVLLFITLYFLQRKLSYVFGICFLGGVAFNYVLKHLIGRPRPYLSHPEIINLTQTMGESMPSSHALCVIVISIFLCYFIFKTTKNIWGRSCAVAGCAVLSILTFISRLYLGLHYLTDIFVGVIIGVVISFLGIFWIEKRSLICGKPKR